MNPREPEDSVVEVPISSVDNFVGALSGKRAMSEIKWYRGQRDYTWNLEPGVSRQRGWRANEQSMLKRFRQDASPRISIQPTTPWAWLALAQHFGLPTRLLDWTENPLIGLFFATTPGPHDKSETDGAFYELDPVTLNSNTITESPHIVMMDEDDILDSYLPSVKTRVKAGAIAAISQRQFGRIVSQSGTFTVHSQLGVDLQDEHDGRHIMKYRIPASRKAEIRAALNDMNVNDSTVYQDLESLSLHIKELYS